MTKFAPVQVTCQFCQKIWQVPYRSRSSKYCSKACSNSGTKRQRVTKTCEHCGTEFDVIKFRAEDARFCTQKCAYDHLYQRPDGPIIISCEGCGSNFETTFINRARRFCSKSCANLGERNAFYHCRGAANHRFGKPAWNSGLTAYTDDRVKRNSEKVSDAISQKIVDGLWTHTGFKTEWYVSKKAGRIFLRSSYESVFARQLDNDNDVVTFTSEPLKIPYTHDERRKNYIPDFLVEYRDGKKEIIEVKPCTLVSSDEVSVKTSAAIKFCNDLGISYRIVTEADLGLTHARGDEFKDNKTCL